MIHLVLGKQGSGKTLYLVERAYDFYKRGLTVYSNVHLNFPYKQLDYNDIIECKLKDGVVILDEVHLLMSARNSMSKRSRVICDGFLSMVRKKNLTIYGSTQTPRKVDVRFREEADYIYQCSKFALQDNKFMTVLHNKNLDKGIPILIQMMVTEMFSGNTIDMKFIANHLFKLYDSNQIILIKGLKI